MKLFSLLVEPREEIYSEDRLLYWEFFHSANKDILCLNQLISEFDHSSDPQNKLEILFEINQLRERVLSNYSPEQFHHNKDFIEIFQKELREEIKLAFNEQQVVSMLSRDLTQIDIQRNGSNKNSKAMQLFSTLVSPDPHQLTKTIHYFLPSNMLYIYPINKMTGYKKTVINLLKPLSHLQQWTPVKQYQYLDNMKYQLRDIILTEPHSQKELQRLRQLIAAVNSQIQQMQTKHPTLLAGKKSNADEMASILANMNQEEFNAFVITLSYGQSKKVMKYNELLEKNYPEGKFTNSDFLTFLENNKLGIGLGTNSKAYQVTNDSGETFLLKFEERMGHAIDIERNLIQNTGDSLLKAPIAERMASIDLYDTQKTYRVMVSAFYSGSDVTKKATQLASSNPEIKLKACVDIFSQMAIKLDELQKNGVALPDMKNSNWASDERGNLHIIDAKSLAIIDKKTGYIQNDKWSNGILTSPGYNDLLSRNRQISADRVHGNALGRNMCFFLANYAPAKSEVIPENFFNVLDSSQNTNDPLTGKNNKNKAFFKNADLLFASPTGQRVKTIINSLYFETAPPPPAKPLTIAEAREALETLNHELNPELYIKRACQLRLDELLTQHPDEADFILQTRLKINASADLEELTLLSTELDNKFLEKIIQNTPASPPLNWKELTKDCHHLMSLCNQLHKDLTGLLKSLHVPLDDEKILTIGKRLLDAKKMPLCQQKHATLQTILVELQQCKIELDSNVDIDIFQTNPAMDSIEAKKTLNEHKNECDPSVPNKNLLL